MRHWMLRFGVLVVVLFGMGTVLTYAQTVHTIGGDECTCDIDGFRLALENSNTGNHRIDFANGCTEIVFDDFAQVTTTGGGLEIDGGGAVTLDAGGKLPVLLEIVAGSNLTVTGLTLQNLLALDPPSPGGTLANLGTLTVRDSLIRNNETATGAGIYNLGTLTVERTTFSNNNALSWGGGIFNNGNAWVYDSTFTSNRAERGAAFYNAGTLALVNSTLTTNAAPYGGAVYNTGVLTVVNSALRGNIAANGGAIFTTQPLTAVNTLISGNVATEYGGGIAAATETVTLVNTTVSSNGADYGGGIDLLNGTLELQNSIVYGNGAQVDGLDLYLSGTHEVRSAASLLVSVGAEADANIINEGGTLTDAGVPPEDFFVDYRVPNAGVVPILGGDFALRYGVVAVNTGNNALVQDEISLAIDVNRDGDLTDPIADLAGNPRIREITVDMGAYETDYAPVEDVNRDGIVSATDVVFVLNRLGGPLTAASVTADVDGDGTITEADAALVVAALGTSAP